MTPKVLVTGATGFVGRHLCPALARAGYQLRAACRADRPVSWPVPMDWVSVGDLGPDTDWRVALAGVTHVVHLAAVAHRIGPQEELADETYDRVNHLATAALGRAMTHTRSVRRLVFVSSIGAVTSLADDVITEKTPCRPDTAYGRSKLAAEDAVRNILAPSPVDWCIFRPTLIYGPGNPGNMDRLQRLLRIPVPLPLASIRNHRSFLYVGNLVDAICLALEHPGASRRIFCLSDGKDLSTPELLRGLASASGKRARLVPFPDGALKLMGRLGSALTRLTGRSFGFDRSVVQKLCGSLAVDISLFREACGWTPPYSLQNGLDEVYRIPPIPEAQEVSNRKVSSR